MQSVYVMHEVTYCKGDLSRLATLIVADCKPFSICTTCTDSVAFEYLLSEMDLGLVAYNFKPKFRDEEMQQNIRIFTHQPFKTCKPLKLNTMWKV